MVTPDRMESKQEKKKVYLNTTQYITNCICVSEESQRK